MFFAFLRQWRNKKTAASPRRTSSGKSSTILSVEGLESRDLLSSMTPMYVLAPQAGSTAPLSAAGPTGDTPAQLSQAYGYNQVAFNNGTVKGNGSGQTIAIIDAYSDPNISNDLNQFDQAFGLSAPPSFTIVNQNGGTALPAASSSWAIEIALDVEWAHAMAPGANILLVEANSSSESDLFSAVQYAASQPGVSVVSMSWGGGEFSSETAYDSVFTTPAGHQGVAFVASAGDSGAPPSYPAVSPNVLAVGGTSLDLNGSSYVGESAWSGSGGGLSAYESQPSYQQGVVSQSATQRASPDVAYDANPSTGVSVYDSYGNSSSAWLQVGGTSAGAPQWAALVAIADQGRAMNGLGTLDGGSQLLPALYALPSSAFHDVTSGSSTGTPSYAAGPGYDLVTGRGSPVANLIVNGLVGQSFSTGGSGSSGSSGSGSGTTSSPDRPPANSPTSPTPSPSPTPAPSPSPSPIHSAPNPLDRVGQDALFLVEGWESMNLSLFLEGWQDFESTVLANQSMTMMLEETLYFDLKADLSAPGY